MLLLPLAAALLRSFFLPRSVLLLENAAFKDVVIKAVVAFYTQYTGGQAKDRIANAVGLQINDDRDQIARQRKRLAARLGRIDKTMRNPLDNITKVNRDLVDQRQGRGAHRAPRPADNRRRARRLGDGVAARAAPGGEARSADGKSEPRTPQPVDAGAIRTCLVRPPRPGRADLSGPISFRAQKRPGAGWPRACDLLRVTPVAPNPCSGGYQRLRPPPERSVRGFASLTLMLRPPRSFPSRALIASRAS